VEADRCLAGAAGQPYLLVDSPRVRRGEAGQHRDCLPPFAKKATCVATDGLATQPTQAGTVLAVVPAAQVWPGDPGRVGKDCEGDIPACGRRVFEHRDQPFRGSADGAGVEDRKGTVSDISDASASRCAQVRVDAPWPAPPCPPQHGKRRRWRRPLFIQRAQRRVGMWFPRWRRVQEGQAVRADRDPPGGLQVGQLSDRQSVGEPRPEPGTPAGRVNRAQEQVHARGHGHVRVSIWLVTRLFSRKRARAALFLSVFLAGVEFLVSRRSVKGRR
jgi:hypothetical protein